MKKNSLRDFSKYDPVMGMTSQSHPQTITDKSVIKKKLIPIEPVEEDIFAKSGKKDKHVVITLPTDLRYNELRKNWDSRFNIYPKIIIQPLDIKGVKSTVKYLHANPKLPFAIRGGRHCFEPWSLSRGAIVDLGKMNWIEFDPVSETVSIGPGALLGDIYTELNKHGRFVPAGTRPSVGIGGQGLNGGIGYSTRAYGLLTDSIIEYRVILADGSDVVASKSSNPDLFWALRGCGAGNFGIVVEYILKTHPTQKVSVFTYEYALDKYGKQALKWLTTIGLSDDVFDQENEHLTCQGLISKGSVKITGQLFGPIRKLEKCLSRLPQPNKAEIKYVDFIEAVAYWSAPTKKESAKAKSRFVSEPLHDSTIDDFFASMSIIGDKDARFTIGIQQLKGEAKGSVPWKESKYWINWMLRWEKGPEPDAEKLEELYLRTLPVCDSWSYMGMMDLHVDPNGYEGAYYGKGYAKLIRIKEKYDPNDFFVYKQDV